MRYLSLLGGAVLALVSAVGLAAQTPGDSAIDGSTPLHLAVRQNDIKTVDALIKNGADVKAASRYGVTPIGLAALNGNTAILRRLLDAGADPNTATPGGETALMTASRTGNAEAVTALLDRKADVNAKDPVRSQTALMWAVTENHPDIVKLLAARGASVNARTQVKPPRGEYVIVLQGAPPRDEVTDAEIRSALHVALAGHSRKDAVEAVVGQLDVPKRRVYDLALAEGRHV